MRKAIESQLAINLDTVLVRELLDAHEEARRNFYLGGFRLSEVEGGRFCTAAFRILEQITTGKWTPLGKQLNTEKLIESTENTRRIQVYRFGPPSYTSSITFGL